MNRPMRLGLLLVAIVVIGLVAVVTVIVNTTDYSRIKAFIETAVSDATGRKLTIAGDLSLSISLNPQLVTGDVTLTNASWGSKPSMLKIGKLKAGIKLLPLFVGDVEIHDIQFIDTDVLLETDANGLGNWHFTAPKNSRKRISIKRLRVNQLKLRRFVVTYRNGQSQSTEHYTADTLELNRLPGTDLLSVALTGNLNGQPATFSGQTGSLFMSANYPVNLSGEVAGIAFKIEGEIGNLLKAEELDLAVQASGTNLATLGTGINVEIPTTDSFSMSAQLAGNGDAVTMSNASATIKHSGVVLALTGGIGNLNTLEGMHFELTGSGDNLSELQAIAGSTKLPDTGPFKVSGKLSGSARALSFTNAQGDLRHHSVKLSATGKVNDVIALTGIDVNLKGSGNNLSELQAIAGSTKLPDTGPFKVNGKLSGSARALSFTNAQGDLHHHSIKLSATGKVNDVIALTGIDVNLKGSGDNLSELQAIAGSTKLPDTGPFKISGNLNGSARALSFTNAQGDLRHHSVKLSATGKVNDVIALTGIDVNLKGSGDNLSELQAIAGSTKLPDTGPFKVNGKLSGSARALSFTNAQGDLRHHSVKLSATGKVNDVIALTGIDVNLEASGDNLSELQTIAGSTRLPDTVMFTASARLSGTAKALALRDAVTVIKQKDSQLKVNGKIASLQQLGGIDLSFKGSGKEFSELGPTFGTQLPDLGPFQISGQLFGSGDALDLKNVYAVIEQSDFNADGQVTFGQRPKVSLQIESALIDFTRLIGEAEKLLNQEISEIQDPEALIFSNKPLPFDLLDAVDADIKLNARRIKARDAALELGKLTMQLDTGELSIDTFEATYKETRISANLSIKSGTPAQVAIKFLVQDFDLGSFLKETHKTQEVEGHVDFAADLHSQGDSPLSLMVALNGTTGAVIGKGRVPRLLDLLAEDLTSRVIPFWGHQERAGELNCSVIEFSITQGIATSKIFLIDTYLAHSKIEGNINLGTEKIDFLLTPKPKKSNLIDMSTELHVTGSFNNPKVAATASGLTKKSAKGISKFTLLGPLGLLFPFEKLDADLKHPCDMPKLKSTIDAIYH